MTPAIVTPDRFTRRVLCLIAAILALIAMELWVAMPGQGPQARAQIPDSGLQRHQLIDDVRKTNELLERVLKHLETQRIKVTTRADEKNEAAGPGGRRG
jgi:hypothetical protein